MQKPKLIFALAALMALASPALAQKGPVAKVCAADIQKFCAGKSHGTAQIRTCLEANREKVTAECRTALDNTGPGRRP